MKKVISKEGVYAIASETINQRTPEVVTLMQSYGMDVSQSDSKGKIDKAFLSLLPRSRGFRHDFSVLAADVAKDMKVTELNMSGQYLNQDGDKKRKAFGETRVGEVLSNQVVQNLVNTGLSVWAYQKTGGSGQPTTTTDQILNSATVPPAGGGSTQKPDDKDKDKGLGTGAIVGIAVGGIALVGFVIYMVNRGGKAA
jgi:hypothetical protein